MSWYFSKNGIFDFTFRHQSKSCNWAENRPFSFGSHVATTFNTISVIQSAYCRTIPCDFDAKIFIIFASLYVNSSL